MVLGRDRDLGKAFRTAFSAYVYGAACGDG